MIDLRLRENKIISRDELLKSIDQYDVWASILGRFQIGKYIINPFRNDKHTGSCKVIELKGTLLLWDWADGTRMDCVTGYMKMHPNKKWREVCNELMGKLHVSNNVCAKRKVKKCDEVKINIIEREWCSDDITFWKARHVRKAQLERESTRVVPIKGYELINGEESTLITSELCYAYKHGNRYKIYFPMRRKGKFIGNIKGKEDVWEVPGKGGMIITKSHKDMLVLENLTNLGVACVQGEGIIPNDDILERWRGAYVLYDNDAAGIKGAEEIAKRIDGKIINIDLPYVKDMDEMVLMYGFKESKDFIHANTRR